MKIIKTIFLVILLSNKSYGFDKEFSNKFGQSREQFCKVKNWEKGLNTKKEVGVKLFNKLRVATPIEGKFAIEKLKKENWIVIDARDKEARRATGVVSGTILLTSDYNKKSENEFSRDLILKVMSKRKNKKILKNNKINEINEISDLNNIKMILFCNGYKCHRSTWGACQLREYGVPFENIFIVLGGFSQLKDQGAKIK
ncbi:hypothetical protein A9Q84_13930 [Halobacteriovorax marinus]|uniref:Rhodanese domain-containing protein n=1 Tax=Halobacteriovorax marinus TaxID=97084 RepID=A0A1Y5FEU9_9BACT|nr:hypothetical protein A9Q84_13930 [Halobacteriovorax marinus]